MTLPAPDLALFTTETPSSTQNGTGDDGLHPDANAEVDWAVWVIVAGCLVCLISAALGYVVMVWLPRRGYSRLEDRREQMLAFTQLLEEVRGRPRKVDPEASLTDSERHFLIHDFADFP